MTTPQKTFVTATVAILAGVGIYQTFQVAQLRKLNQVMVEQQTQLPERFRQMQREHDEATNRLATLSAENVQLKSSQNELFKLRGPATRLEN